ncbi:hypothetical protein DFQ14_107149 [Halopolyspora algeriensis]|uniref:Uncharacterized protein n=1 Tax=Halopolyspora algeriensis TaxID=1500506 RepID=A0A368VP16_9ACTN|nr:hypothetical protein DFQ14_107149 [Halopolyspora algeriensis]TQM56319.1 hypothetical protein FHU43_1113 [Halopolyspora algeriensis]
MQNYLRETVHAQAAHLRRQDALAATAERLRGRPEVPAEERNVVLDAIEDAHNERADQLGNRSTP